MMPGGGIGEGPWARTRGPKVPASRGTGRRRWWACRPCPRVTASSTWRPPWVWPGSPTCSSTTVPRAGAWSGWSSCSWPRSGSCAVSDLAGAGAAAAVCWVAGALLFAVGVGIAVPHLTKTGLTAVSVAGLLVLGGGLALLAHGTSVLLRGVTGWRRPPVAVGLLVGLLVILLSLGQAVAATNVPRTSVGPRDPGDVGLAHRDVEYPASDGVRLSAWYVPSRNGAVRRPPARRRVDPLGGAGPRCGAGGPWVRGPARRRPGPRGERRSGDGLRLVRRRGCRGGRVLPGQPARRHGRAHRRHRPVDGGRGGDRCGGRRPEDPGGRGGRSDQPGGGGQDLALRRARLARHPPGGRGPADLRRSPTCSPRPPHRSRSGRPPRPPPRGRCSSSPGAGCRTKSQRRGTSRPRPPSPWRSGSRPTPGTRTRSTGIPTSGSRG